MVTCLRSRCSLWLKYKGSSDIIVYRPQVCVKWARTIAHNGKEEKIAFHGIGTSCKRNKRYSGPSLGLKPDQSRIATLILNWVKLAQNSFKDLMGHN